MLNVACVQWGNYEGRGAEYVAKLFGMVARHLPAGLEWRGVCLTNDTGTVPDGIWAKMSPLHVEGWWNKIALFRDNAFPDGDRVLYFDLDTVILGSLADVACYSGKFAALSNIWGDGLASGVMAWEAGQMDHIWGLWERAGRPEAPQGDQQWINFVARSSDRLQRLYPDQFVSFKADCQDGPPDGARVVYFHGQPRPHEVSESWVNKAWTA